MVEPASRLRIAVVAALPFPAELGSQVFVAEQLRALARAGADATLLCYAAGDGRDTREFDVERAPRWASSKRVDSGPDAWKPLTDLSLLARYVGAHRRRRFDVALAHNAEAAITAIAARPLLGVPVVYVAHTLLARELPLWGAPRLARSLAAGGSAIDRGIARRADGIIALCDAAAASLRAEARGRVLRLPPGFERGVTPGMAARARACRRHGLEADRFILYSGNFDRYQDLEFLGEAAARAPELTIVVATHGPARRVHPALRVIRVRDREEMRALAFAARAAALPRRAPGGFPIKLLAYMEAALPIVAFGHVADGLGHTESALLLGRGEGPDAFARAMRELSRDRELAKRLGAAARKHLERCHDWLDIGAETEAFARDCARARDHSG